MNIPNLPIFNADITKAQLSHRQMVILAQVFLNWSKDPKSADQKDRLMEWSSELVKTAREVGVGWEASNPQQSSVIGHVAQHYEREVG